MVRRSGWRWLAGGLVAAGLAAGCGDEASDGGAGPGPNPSVDEAPETPPLESDLVPATPAGKTDTGYLSDLAVELEGTLESEIRVDLRHQDEAEREAWQTRLAEGGWFVQSLLDPQIKFAKNQINTEALHLNLSASSAEVQDVRVDEDGFAHVRYRTVVETIVSHEALRKAGLTLAQVLEESYSAILPDRPDAMAAEVGTACQTADQTEAHDYNYFYYFAPDREGCPEAMETADIRRVGARLELRNLAPAKTVYPEYDQLTADRRIDVVAFFGAAEYGWEPGRWDWGTYQRDLFVRDLRSRGFRPAEAAEGERFVRTARGLEQIVTVIGPETLKSLKDDADGLFKRLVRENEIVFYNGHSFYGSLRVLDDPDLYPKRYQIFLMNSCWSYEYYTKQVFRQNATEDDPQGWLLADVVNDTESGWFHNMAGVSRILLFNLLQGAETGGVEGDRYFTWDRIIGAINVHVLEEQRRRGTETHEIYGVSGVTTNRYEPANR